MPTKEEEEVIHRNESPSAPNKYPSAIHVEVGEVPEDTKGSAPEELNEELSRTLDEHGDSIHENRGLFGRAADALQRTQMKLESDLLGYQARAANFFARKHANGSGAAGRGGGAPYNAYDEDDDDDIASTTSDGTRSDHSNTLSGFSGMTGDSSSQHNRGRRRSTGTSRKRNSRLSTSSLPDSDALLRYRERQLAKIMGGGGASGVGSEVDFEEAGEDDDTYFEDDVDDYRPHDDGDSSVGNSSFVHQLPSPSDATRTSTSSRRRRRQSANLADTAEDRNSPLQQHPPPADVTSPKLPYPKGPIVGYLRVPREEAMLLQQLRVMAKNAHRRAAAAAGGPSNQRPAATHQPSMDVEKSSAQNDTSHPNSSSTFASSSISPTGTFSTHSPATHSGNINGPLGLDNVQLVRVVKAKKTINECASTVEKYASLCDRLGLRLITFDDVADVLSRRCMAVLDPLTLKVDDSYVFYVEGRYLMEVMASMMDDLRAKKKTHQQSIAAAAGAVIRTTSISSSATLANQNASENTISNTTAMNNEKESKTCEMEGSEQISTVPDPNMTSQSTAPKQENSKKKSKGFFSNLFSSDKKDKRKQPTQNPSPAQGKIDQNTTSDSAPAHQHVDPNTNENFSAPRLETNFSQEGLNQTEIQSVYTSVLRAMLFLIETRVVGLVHNNAATTAVMAENQNPAGGSEATAASYVSTVSGSTTNDKDDHGQSKRGDFSGVPGPDPEIEKKAAAKRHSELADQSSRNQQQRVDIKSPDRISFVVCLDGVDTSHAQSLLLHMKRFLADAYPIRVCGIYLLNSHSKHIEWHLKRHGIAGSTATSYLGHLAHVDKERKTQKENETNVNTEALRADQVVYSLPPLTGVKNKFTFFLSVQTLKVQLLSVKMMRRLHTADDLFDVVDVELLDKALRNARMDGFLPPLPTNNN